MIPDDHRYRIEKIFGGDQILRSSDLSGGCISDAYCLNMSSGIKVFAKISNEATEMFLCESNGLKEIHYSESIAAPVVLHADEHCLILQFVESGSPSKDFWSRFGADLARMHKTNSEEYGFYEDNFIGLSPQINNPPSHSWAEFFIERRLRFQFELAEKKRFVDESFQREFSNILKPLTKFLEEFDEPPSLLHGDLWGGNYLCSEDSTPVVIDPAIYYGNRESDLAMTQLFGAFPNEFYRAYDKEFPLKEGWQERLCIYKLYHILNHLNLFGASYVEQARGLILQIKKLTD